MFRKGLLLVLVAALLGAVAPPVAHAQDPETACYDAGRTWDYVHEKCIAFAGLTFEMAYPQSYALYPFAQAVIDDFITTQRETSYGYLFDLPDLQFFVSASWEIFGIYEIYDLNPSVQTVAFSVYQYLGGAHGNTFYQTYTFDFENERVLALEAVFAPEADFLPVISTSVQTDLNARLTDMTDPDWIATGTGENIENYRDFVLTPDGILFLFEPYQVAAYAAGPQESLVAWETLAGLVADGLVAESGTAAPMAPADAAPDAEQCWEMGYTVTDEGTCVAFSGFEYRADYPLDLMAIPLVQATVDDFIAGQQAAFTGIFADDPNLQFFVAYPFQSVSSYSVSNYNAAIFTLTYETYEFTGGAHGNTYFDTFSFDRTAERVLALEDVFADGATFMPTITEIVAADLQSRGLGWFDEASRDNIDNYRDFVLTPEGLLFLFEPYLVGVYAEGPQSALVEWAALDGLLAAPFAG